MPSTYTTNNGIELIGTGEQSGTWGDTTNTNLTLVDASLDGHTTITLVSAGTSGSPNSLPITDGSASNGRNRALIFADGGDLGADVYVQLSPNDAKKIIFVRNSLSGSRNLILFQGTYSASNDFVLAAGKDAIVKFDGGGSGAIASAVLADLALDAATITTISNTTLNTATVNATTVDTTNVEVTNLKAKDGTASATIANSTGVMTVASSVLTTTDINGGTIDGTTIGASVPAAGNFTTVDTTNLEVTNIKAKDGTASATIADSTGVMTIASSVLTTADINGGTIDGTTIGGSSAAAGTFTTATATTGNITTVNSTTVDTTNIEVTNLKAKDGTAAGSIADSTGVVTLASSVLTTTDINGGTIDGAVIGGSSAAAITGTTITGSTLVSTGDITVTGTVDGRDVATDGTKLDGIEAGADVTDTVNVTAAGALMDSELTDITAVKALNQGVATTDSPSFAGLTVDTNTLYVDATNNRVGINNATPSQPLDVVGAIKTNSGLLFGATSSYMYESAADTIAWRIGADGPFFTMGEAGSYNVNLFNVSGAIAFGAQNSEKMRLTTTGRLGIGTSTPGVALDVVGSERLQGVSTEGVSLSMGTGRSGDGASYVDLVGDATYTTYGSRLVRFGGANSNTVLYHRGTGNLSLNVQDAGGILLATTNTERMRVTSAGNVGIGTNTPAEQLHITGNLRVGSAVLSTPSGSAPMYACRAWVNFNGTGTVAIRASGNVSSITDNGTGDYTINFTTAMPDADYSVVGTGKRGSLNEPGAVVPITYATTSVRVVTGGGSFTQTDSDYVNVAIFR